MSERTSEASEIFRFETNTVLAASAGTGKTFHLVGILVHALLGFLHVPGARFRPISGRRIIATTFSRKAAKEIRERIESTLRGIAHGDVSEALDVFRHSMMSLAASAGETPPPKLLQARAKLALAEMRSLSFGTIHSFAYRILERAAIREEHPPPLLVTEEDKREDTLRVVEDELMAFAALHPRSLARLVHVAGGMDVLAGQLVDLVSRMIETGLASLPLLPDDDSKVWERWELRWNSFLTSSTFLKLDEAARARLTSQEKRIRIRALGDLFIHKDKHVANCVREEFADFPPNKDKRRLGENVASMLSHWRMLKEDAIPFATLVETIRTKILAAARASNVYTFSQALLFARDLLAARPEVGAEFRAGTDLFLIDEAQDTSPLQRELVRYVWEEAPERRAPGDPPGPLRSSGLLLVGDRKQSIYGFRGADVRGFGDFCRELTTAASPARKFALKVNRRSTPALLRWFNAFSARMMRAEESPFDIAYEKASEDLESPNASDAATEARTTPRVTWLKSRISSSYQSSSSDLALATAEKVAAILHPEDTATPVPESSPSIQPRDIAILAMTHAVLAHVAHALSLRDIPYVLAGFGFWHTFEVRDAIAWLACVCDPSNSLALLSVLRGPWVALLDETLVLLSNERGLRDPSTFEEWRTDHRISKEERAALVLFVDTLRVSRSNARNATTGDLFRMAAKAFEWEGIVRELPNGAQRVSNLRKLGALAHATPDLATFVDASETKIREEAREEDAPLFSEDDNAVRLLTAHACKGLEFPHVLIAGFGHPTRAQGFPAALRVSPHAHRGVLAFRHPGTLARPVESPSFREAVDEEKAQANAEYKRLLYVAMTRAKDSLTLVCNRKPTESESYERSAFAVLEALRTDHPELMRVENA
ncbi:MAG: UvrD-helicase domain-containing protein [Polyangiaceae bacterium]|nr:UvrD-helicase domain-containing protein [Polyangiaceae bacterium]